MAMLKADFHSLTHPTLRRDAKTGNTALHVSNSSSLPSFSFLSASQDSRELASGFSPEEYYLVLLLLLRKLEWLCEPCTVHYRNGRNHHRFRHLSRQTLQWTHQAVNCSGSEVDTPFILLPQLKEWWTLVERQSGQQSVLLLYIVSVPMTRNCKSKSNCASPTLQKSLDEVIVWKFSHCFLKPYISRSWNKVYKEILGKQPDHSFHQICWLRGLFSVYNLQHSSWRHPPTEVF